MFIILTNPINYQLMEKYHLLRIGKTGTSALRSALKPIVNNGFTLQLHPHEDTLAEIPIGEKLIFSVRDPLTRFISGFYTRQRKGRPKNNSEWSDEEKIAFGIFNSPEQLAIGIGSRNIIKRRKAHHAMKNIYHIRHNLDYWFKSIDSLLNREKDLFYILRQENLNRDFKFMLELLNIKEKIYLPTNEIEMHKNTFNLDYELSDRARYNLMKWYENDYIYMDYFSELAEKNNWW